MQMTKAEIAQTQIIVTTPEKWDVVTRKPTGEGELASVSRSWHSTSRTHLSYLKEHQVIDSGRNPSVERRPRCCYRDNRRPHAPSSRIKPVDGANPWVECHTSQLYRRFRISKAILVTFELQPVCLTYCPSVSTDTSGCSISTHPSARFL